MFGVEGGARSRIRAPPAPSFPADGEGAGASIFLTADGVDMAEQLFLFANELRTRAKEILALAVSTDDLEIRNMRRVIAAGYEKLARRIEQRARETVEA